VCVYTSTYLCARSAEARRGETTDERSTRKDPRNPYRWSNVEIEQDAPGYIAAQEAFRHAGEEAETRRREEDDLQRFSSAYVEAGGDHKDARAAFREQRGQQAAAAATKAEASVLADARRRIRQAL